MNQTNTEARDVFIYTGLPGAGKTTVSQMASEMMGGSHLETGDYARKWAEEEGHTTSEAVGEWVAEQRDVQGPAFIEERLVGELLREDVAVTYPLHVDGVRHIEGVKELRNFATSAFLVVVKAEFGYRLERIQERGREDEAEFTDLDLLERDRRELNDLGTATILNSNETDVVVSNNFDETDPLREEVNRMVNDYKAFSRHG